MSRYEGLVVGVAHGELIYEARNNGIGIISAVWSRKEERNAETPNLSATLCESLGNCRFASTSGTIEPYNVPLSLRV